jgi:hypothetical protein
MHSFRYKRYLYYKKILLATGNLSFLISVLMFFVIQHTGTKAGFHSNLMYFSLLVGAVTFTTGLILFPLLYGRSESVEKQHVADLFSEVTKLLTSKEIEKVTALEIFNAAEKCKTNYLDAQDELRRVYTSTLLYYLRARTLRDAEINNLLHIRKILMLSDRQIRKAEKEIQHPMLRRAVSELLLEQTMFEERPMLEQLRSKALLQEDFRLPLQNEGALGPQQRVRNRIDFDKELTLREEDELKELKADLQIEREEPRPFTKILLETYRLYWFLNNDELPEIHMSEFIPRKGEKLHYETDAALCISGKFVIPNTDVPTLINKIFRGHFWRAEAPITKRLQEEGWIPRDEGKLYVTSQRIAFEGAKTKESFPLERLVDFNPFTNGVEIQPVVGRAAFFHFMNGTEAVAVTIGAAIKAFFQG